MNAIEVFASLLYYDYTARAKVHATQYFQSNVSIIEISNHILKNQNL